MIAIINMKHSSTEWTRTRDIFTFFVIVKANNMATFINLMTCIGMTLNFIIWISKLMYWYSKTIDDYNHHHYMLMIYENSMMENLENCHFKNFYNVLNNGIYRKILSRSTLILKKGVLYVYLHKMHYHRRYMWHIRR